MLEGSPIIRRGRTARPAAVNGIREREAVHAKTQNRRRSARARRPRRHERRVREPRINAAPKSFAFGDVGLTAYPMLIFMFHETSTPIPGAGAAGAALEICNPLCTSSTVSTATSEAPARRPGPAHFTGYAL